MFKCAFHNVLTHRATHIYSTMTIQQQCKTINISTFAHICNAESGLLTIFQFYAKRDFSLWNANTHKRRAFLKSGNFKSNCFFLKDESKLMDAFGNWCVCVALYLRVCNALLLYAFYIQILFPLRKIQIRFSPFLPISLLSFCYFPIRFFNARNRFYRLSNPFTFHNKVLHSAPELMSEH